MKKQLHNKVILRAIAFIESSTAKEYKRMASATIEELKMLIIK